MQNAVTVGVFPADIRHLFDLKRKYYKSISINAFANYDRPQQVIAGHIN